MSFIYLAKKYEMGFDRIYRKTLKELIKPDQTKALHLLRGALVLPVVRHLNCDPCLKKKKKERIWGLYLALGGCNSWHQMTMDLQSSCLKKPTQMKYSPWTFRMTERENEMQYLLDYWTHAIIYLPFSFSFF